MSMTCCVCGRGDRMFESCNARGCYNLVCVDECAHPCRPNVRENTWTCAKHGGDGGVVYNANLEVDIRVLTSPGFPSADIFTYAAGLVSYGYRAGQFRVTEQTVFDASSLETALCEPAWRRGATHLAIAGLDVDELYQVWVEDTPYTLPNFLAWMLQYCNGVVLPVGIHKAINSRQLTDLLAAIAAVVGGGVVMLLTRPELELARIAHGLMRCLEESTVMDKQMPDAMRHLGVDEHGTPGWVFARGCGYYLILSAKWCAKHPYSQRFKGKHCVGFDREGNVYAHRCHAPNYIQ